MPDTQRPEGPDEFPDVRAALADLAFLRPDAPVAPAMPDDVWDRLEHAIATEASARAAQLHGNVVVLTPRRRRWAGGLVAAAVTVVAVGTGVALVQGTASQPIVATQATAGSDSAKEAAPLALAEPPAEGGSGSPAAAAPAAPPSASAVVRASRIVMASNTDYTASALRSQVTSMVKERFATPEDAYAEQVAPVDLPDIGGFTQTWEALRNCLWELTASSTIQALVVDRGTFDGSAAGVIVTPVERAAGVFDVWVVNEDCQQLIAPLDDFALYEWTP